MVVTIRRFPEGIGVIALGYGLQVPRVLRLWYFGGLWVCGYKAVYFSVAGFLPLPFFLHATTCSLSNTSSLVPVPPQDPLASLQELLAGRIARTYCPNTHTSWSPAGIQLALWLSAPVRCPVHPLPL